MSMPDKCSPEEIIERYLKVHVAAVNDVLRIQHGLLFQSFPSNYRPLQSGMKLAGFAFTIKGMPSLEIEGEMEKRAEMLEALPANSVTVWDCTGDTVTAQWGEVMTMAAKKRGCLGAVVNGVRDTDRVIAQNFPVFHLYRTSSGMLGRFRMIGYGMKIMIGEALVSPGDFIFGDDDGIVVIPRHLIMDVLEKAEAILRNEVMIKNWVAGGMKPAEVVRRGGYF